MRALLAVLAGLTLVAAPAAAAGDGPSVPAGFSIERIATVPGARELAATPNGDLLVGTASSTVYLVAGAQGAAHAAPFVSVDDHPVAGVALAGDRLFLGSQFGVWELAYHAGDRTARERPHKIASVRTNGQSRDHVTTTVAVDGDTLYASVGSSCNTCDPELDDTRASIQMMGLDGTNPHARARHVRNAIALAVNPRTHALWAGVAGQDELPHGHPYEMFDAVTLHPDVADYGWPYCYENHRSVGGHDCANTAVPRVVFPAYETPIGATFYPLQPGGAHAFPARYRGGAFVTLHGSWHQPPVPPRVVFVPLDGDTPAHAVDWDDPTTQWTEFVGGFQRADGARIARPTGIAVGSDGSLFVSDDMTGGIYRIRPART